jgi:HSP20 family molecular chaperone IbpA
VDAKKIEADYDNGILEINLPKIPGTKPKKVSVSAKKKAKARR